MKQEYKKQVAKALFEAASILSAASSVHLISEDGDEELLFEQAHDLFNSQGIHLHSNYDRFFVLFDDADDERVVATAAMCLYDDEPPSIEFSVAVAPDQQRKGLAKKLVEEVIRYTQQSSTEFGWGDDTEVEAYVANEQAMIPLLRGLGFEPSATDPKRWRRKAVAVVSATSVKANYEQLPPYGFIEPGMPSDITKTIINISESPEAKNFCNGPNGYDPMNCTVLSRSWERVLKESGIEVEHISGQYWTPRGPWFHEYLLVGPNGHVFDPTAAQFTKGKIPDVDLYDVSGGDTDDERGTTLKEWREEWYG